MPYVAAWARGRTTQEILTAAEQFRLPFERVSTVDALAHDAHAQARRMFPRVVQPGLGEVPVARLGLTLSAHEHPALQPAPAIGEHTERVLADWLGYTPAQVQELHAKGILPPQKREEGR
jgi:crotonobetainyl-CoA:carnitine CoA-transferase CaiB-like acyl-CoA transferase